MNTRVRQAVADDAAAFSEVVQAGFMQHVAPDWEPAAREDFLRDTTADKLAAAMAAATFAAVYEDEGRVVGAILLPRPTLVQLFFVRPGHLGRGAGKALWEAARTHLEQRHADVRTVELNATPYAVPVYKALGFFPISEPFRRGGAVATRMACWLPARGLERA